MSEQASIFSQGWTCETCLFSYYWEEERTRRVCERPWGFFRDPKYRSERYTASGIQCLRYPEPMDTEADSGCGEYRAASVDRNPEGEDPQGLRAKHESAVAKPDARKHPS